MWWRQFVRMLHRTVADPGFSQGGCDNSQKCYYFSFFLPTTAWEWKNLDPGGIPGAPLGSTNAEWHHFEDDITDKQWADWPTNYHRTARKFPKLSVPSHSNKPALNESAKNSTKIGVIRTMISTTRRANLLNSEENPDTDPVVQWQSPWTAYTFIVTSRKFFKCVQNYGNSQGKKYRGK